MAGLWLEASGVPVAEIDHNPQPPMLHART